MTFAAILPSIVPIFLIIVLGFVLRRNGIPNVEFWNQNDRLVYWVLMPALLFYNTATIEISFDLLGRYAAVILGGFFAALIFGVVAARLAGMAAPVASSVMQGASRHNTFISLSVAASLFGEEGLALAALGTAILIPVTNICVVTLMVVMIRPKGQPGVLAAVLRDVARNPLLLAVVLGLVMNLAGLGKLPVVIDIAEILGGAALPIVLMCVGANLRPSAMRAAWGPLGLSMVGKFAVFPVVLLAIAAAIGLSETETMVALLYGAAPTASASYTLARQMGGDAPLMAAIVTIQTAVAFLMLPLWMMGAAWFF